MVLAVLQRLRFLAVLVFALGAFGEGAQAADAPSRAPLILISIDGFRWDYLNRGVSPNLTALAAGGVRAERMLPSFPSITFPNHYTLVTGLYPDHHGVVANTFEDPAAPGGVFHMSSKDEVWWAGGTPLWDTARSQGIVTATEFWPGSETAIRGVRPDYWDAYNAAKGGDRRVDQVLAWLDLPPAQRPGFITLYFEAVDSGGHLFGPDSPQVNTAIASVDGYIGRLVAGLKARNMPTDIIVVADHGMAAVSRDNTVYLDDLADASAMHVVFTDAVAGIDIPDTPAGRAAEARLLGAHPHLTCWKKGEVPKRLHYGTNPRVPDVVCMADVGWLVESRAEAARHHFPLKGEHGYDNQAPEMGALFIASGPDFKAGAVLPPFPNVDVYPLMAKLLGVKPEPNDGDIAPVQAALAR
ncbi:alkaline phosphatase family protein [Phenylobacterium montanum]|uniref:alkaline phosphatase family protein n=1 Tax=Phenylobacterium montanum TaxID=2823693 RepID=UPI002012853A|nr:ectonucleotide pyrophosphatase/phosphodiesterase [Caulobacter sp. S6]